MVISLLYSSDQRMEKKNFRWHNSAIRTIKCYGLCPIYSPPALHTFDDEDSHYAAQPTSSSFYWRIIKNHSTDRNSNGFTLKYVLYTHGESRIIIPLQTGSKGQVPVVSVSLTRSPRRCNKGCIFYPFNKSTDHCPIKRDPSTARISCGTLTDSRVL